MNTSLRIAALACLLAAAGRADSLWPAAVQGERALIADHKAAHTGDIVTVVIAESATAQNSQQRKDSRSSTLQDTVSQFLYSTAASKLGTHKGELPAINITGKSDFNGGGQVDNSQSVTARAAVLVVDVLPNGNLVLEGVRLVTFSGETQYVVLHGIARPDDITSDNTIASTNIADARIEIYNEGSLTDVQKRGWLSRLYEKLRLF